MIMRFIDAFYHRDTLVCCEDVIAKILLMHKIHAITDADVFGVLHNFITYTLERITHGNEHW